MHAFLGTYTHTCTHAYMPTCTPTWASTCARAYLPSPESSALSPKATAKALKDEMLEYGRAAQI